MAYVLPQVKVFQQFRQISQEVVGNLNACIIGPHYTLARYDEASEKILTKFGAYLSNDPDVDSAKKYPMDAKNVDTDYVKVFFEHAIATYAGLDNAFAVNGIVRNNYIRHTYTNFYKDIYPEGEEPVDTCTVQFLTSGLAEGVEDLRKSGSITANDKFYIVPHKFSGNRLAGNRVCVYYKSAITGDIERYGQDDYCGAEVPSTGNVNVGALAISGLTADSFPFRISATIQNGDSPVFSIILRQEYIVDFLDALYAEAEIDDDTEDFKDAVPFTCRINTTAGAKVSVNPRMNPFTGIRTIELSIPEIASNDEIESKLLSDPQFNRYFVVDERDTGDWPTGTQTVVEATEPNKPGPAYCSAIAVLGTIEDFDVHVGDVISGDNGLYGIVRSFKCSDDASYIGSVSEITDGLTFPADWTAKTILNKDHFAPTQVKAKFLGHSDTTYIMTVLANRKFRVYDTSGIDYETIVEVDEIDNDTNTLSVGTLGVKFDLTGAMGSNVDWIPGQVFAVKCFAAASNRENGFEVIAAQNFPPEYAGDEGVAFNDRGIKLAHEFGSLEISRKVKDEDKGTEKVNWEATKDSITLHHDILVELERPKPVETATRRKSSETTPKPADWTEEDEVEKYFATVVSADVYIEYRALDTRYADTVHEVGSTHDVNTMLGVVDMDNPLGQGCYHAVLNSGQRPVFFIAVDENSQEGYARAFEKLETIDNVYALVPMTTDDAVLDDIQAHVKKMSGEETKRWRIAMVGIQTDKIISIYDRSKHPLDNEYSATLAGNLITFDRNDETVAKRDVQPGDHVYFYKAIESSEDGKITYKKLEKSYDVKNVIDNLHIELDIPESEYAATSVYFPKVEIWRELESAEWIDYVANKISAFMDRRMYVVFPEVLWNNKKRYPGYIGAAAVAGLLSSVPPQQGLTHIALNGFDDIPATYSLYTRSQLNHIADYGGLIITQDKPEGVVYIRHQVSTAARDGNLLTTELSVTKNLDAISYYMADILEPYIGKYNITPVLLQQIETTVLGALNYLGSYNTGSGLLGPMLLIDSPDTRIIGIRQHETLKDHIIVSVSLDLPLPCNVIELYLTV